jgi:hypothetical protein
MVICYWLFVDFLNTPISLSLGGAAVSVMRTRSLVVVTAGKYNIRHGPMLVASAIFFQAPSIHASTSTALMR